VGAEQEQEQAEEVTEAEQATMDPVGTQAAPIQRVANIAPSL